MLKNNLQHQLQIKQFSHSYTQHTFKITYNIIHLNKYTSYIIIQQSHINTIKKIKYLHPELCADAFYNLRIFIDREIHRTISQPVVFVSRQIPKLTSSELSERRHIHPLHKLVSARVCLYLMRDSCKQITYQVYTL